MPTVVKRALISVFDKRMLADFARGLYELRFEIIATPGTRQALLEGGIPCRSISDFTGMSDALGGRIKTLHQSIFAGILARRSRPEHMRVIEERKWPAIDLVACNLAPVNQSMNTEEVVERIDIGGAGLLRAAAKNHADVITIIDPNDYESVLRQLQNGDVNVTRRRLLAMKAFAYTASYDQAVSQCFAASARGQSDLEESAATILPLTLSLEGRWRTKLRHGENPHQAAALYQDESCLETSIANAEILSSSGELSLGQVADLDLALEICKDFDEPLAVFVRHGNPCAMARAEQIRDAFAKSLDCDPLRVAGSVAAINRAADNELVPLIVESEILALVAPAYRSSVLEKLTPRRSLMLLRCGPLIRPPMDCQVQPIIGGYLVQDRDLMPENRRNWRVATELEPTPEDLEALVFGWKVVKWVKSCAAAIVDSNGIYGIGAGQANTLDAVRIAIDKASDSAEGAYMAIDLTFGMADGLDVIELAAEAGIRAIIQPGGGPLDQQAAHAADKHGLAMVHTGRRHLRH